MPIHRTIKNVVKNYTPAEIKVREATSNDPWGPPTTLMNEIAELTYNSMALAEIMNMIWKRMSDQGKNWRHVFKSLNLLEYLAKVGSPQVSERCKSQIHALQGLNEFSYYEEGKDCGACIREKSKQFVSLLKDSERFRNERMKALAAKERLAQSTGLGTSKMSHSSSDRYLSTSGRVAATQPALSADLEAARPSSYGEEDLQLQLALAMSKEEHEEELKRRKGDEFKLQLALEESKKINEEFQKTLSSFNQDLLDQNSPLKVSNKSNLPSSSTWDGNLTQPSSAMDPWGVPTPLISPPQRIQHPPKVADPWGDSFLPKEAAPVRAVNDPWSPVATVLSSATSSPWNPHSSSAGGLPAPNPTEPPRGFDNGFGVQQNNSDILDSEFDLLSIRTCSKRREPDSVLQPTSMTSVQSKDYLGDLGEDLLSGTIWSQQQQQQPKQQQQQQQEDFRLKSGKKLQSVEEFLGSNANLVDLNDLITKPPPSTIANPFAMPTNSRSAAVPTNQIAAQPPFGSPWPMAALDANPAPVFSANQIAPSYPQHNNPFL